MNEVEFKAILVAITELVAENPDKKPNVKDVEELVGFDVSADQRDEVYQAYLESPEVSDPVSDESVSDESETATVTNNTNHALSIMGVTIEAGKSGPVPRLEKDNAVIQIWVERGVIKID